jgi:hypothetical protein
MLYPVIVGHVLERPAFDGPTAVRTNLGHEPRDHRRLIGEVRVRGVVGAGSELFRAGHRFRVCAHHSERVRLIGRSVSSLRACLTSWTSLGPASAQHPMYGPKYAPATGRSYRDRVIRYQPSLPPRGPRARRSALLIDLSAPHVSHLSGIPAAASATFFAPARSRLAESKIGTICRSPCGVAVFGSGLGHAAKNMLR